MPAALRHLGYRQHHDAKPAEFHFPIEILGRSTLDSRLPVLLVKAPNLLERQQRRNSFRISAALK